MGDGESDKDGDKKDSQKKYDDKKDDGKKDGDYKKDDGKDKKDMEPSAELKAAMKACQENELCKKLMECKKKHKESGGKGDGKEVCVEEMKACAADKECSMIHEKLQAAMKKEGGYGGKGGDGKYDDKKEGGYGGDKKEGGKEGS